jgi:transcriptional regulator with XRE-family HTH domain
MELNTQRLVDLRVKNGWSQAETARQAGINQSYYSALERGVRKPSPDMAALLAGTLGVPLEELTL